MIRDSIRTSHSVRCTNTAWGWAIGANIPRKIKHDGSGAQKTLVYFRHRVITNPQVFNRRFLKAYLLWWDLNLPRLLGPGQYGLLGVSYQSQDPDKFRRIVTEELKLELLAYQNTVCRVLVRFTDIDESHLNEFIQMVGFPLPAEGRAEILQEIVSARSGCTKRSSASWRSGCDAGSDGCCRPSRRLNWMEKSCYRTT